MFEGAICEEYFEYKSAICDDGEHSKWGVGGADEECVEVGIGSVPARPGRGTN